MKLGGYAGLACIAAAVLSLSGCGNRYAIGVVTEVPKASPFRDNVRVSPEPASYKLCDIPPADVGQPLFGEDCGLDVAPFFQNILGRALRDNHMLAPRPEAAHYELTQKIHVLHVQPAGGGTNHQSEIVYAPNEVGSGKTIWSSTQKIDTFIPRGFRYGKLFGAMGAGVGAAVAGGSPQQVSAAANAQAFTAPSDRHARTDMKIDLYEGIGMGYSQAAATIIPQIVASQGSN